MGTSGRVHDRAILDALDGMDPAPVKASVWRVTRTGRDPLRGSAAYGRWSPGGTVEVLYTSLEREGALAEIGFRLSLEPIWPSRIEHEIHEIAAQTRAPCSLRASMALLLTASMYPNMNSFDYDATQALAAAAHFLEFDGLLVPSARHPSTNLVLFMDRDAAVASRQACRSGGLVGWRKDGVN